MDGSFFRLEETRLLRARVRNIHATPRARVAGAAAHRQETIAGMRRKIFPLRRIDLACSAS